MQNVKLLERFLFSAVCLLILGGTVWAQDEQPADRSIDSLDFQKQRPKGASAKAGVGSVKPAAKKPSAKRQEKIALVSRTKRRYNHKKTIRAAQPKTAAPVKSNGSIKNPVKSNAPVKNEQLGVTFWRLRPIAADEEDAPTFPVKINKTATENWTAERVGSATTFQKGDRVRFTIESSRSGFLYVVNREFYADGTKSEAEIIYPTLRNRGGDNRVAAGSLIEIPPASDSSPYFNVNPKNANYAGEELIVVISPIKFEDIEIQLKAQGINREKLEKWLADWSATVDIYDAEDGEGVALTASETETVGSRALTREEPLPQTIYRVKTRADIPLVVPFQMQARVP